MARRIPTLKAFSILAIIAAAGLGCRVEAQAGVVYARSTASQVTQTAAGWAPTATRAVVLRNASLMAAAPPSMAMHVLVGLAMRNRTGADLLLRREHTPGDALYRVTLSPAQYTAMFNPTSAQAGAVAAYLAKMGFRNIAIEPNNLLVSGTAAAAQVGAAFHTTIGLFSQSGQLVYGNTTPALVPASLNGTVLAVLGLNNAYRMHVHLHVNPRLITTASTHRALQTPPPCFVGVNGKCVSGEYNGPEYQSIYDASNPARCRYCTTGMNTSVAVMAEGNVYQVLNDLRTEESSVEGIPGVPYSVRQVGIPSPDLAGLDEWDLDTQMSTGIAQIVKHLYVYDTTSLTDSDIALEFSKWVTDDLAQAGNASFGECESFAYADGSMLVDDEEFLQGANQGQTMFSSTGDNGNGCPIIAATGVPGTGVPENSYPATSPYVVGVGGTSLVTNTPAKGAPPTAYTYNSEVTWVGSGGGVSAVEYSPYWQSGIVLALYTTVGKTIPDISMCADENVCPAEITVNGAQIGVGGTSLSSPLAMGSWARMETGRNNSLGFAAPDLYHVYRVYEPCPQGSTVCVPPTPPVGAINQNIGGFHDILFGSNGGPYGTLPGYDLETGLGSFDICVMAQHV
mgnify:CR=1 FL=1